MRARPVALATALAAAMALATAAGAAAAAPPSTCNAENGAAATRAAWEGGQRTPAWPLPARPTSSALETCRPDAHAEPHCSLRRALRPARPAPHPLPGKEFFAGIPRIRFEGPDSTNPLAFRYYNASELIMGKPMRDWCAADLLHTQLRVGGLGRHDRALRRSAGGAATALCWTLRQQRWQQRWQQR